MTTGQRSGHPRPRSRYAPLACRPPRWRRSTSLAGLFIHQRRRQSRSRAGVLQRGVEARPRQRHEGRIDEVAASARSSPRLCIVDDRRRRAVTDYPAASRARVDPDDNWGLRASGSVERPGGGRRDRFGARLKVCSVEIGECPPVRELDMDWAFASSPLAKHREGLPKSGLPGVL